MRILVTGATGKVGQALIAAVLGSPDHAAIEIRALCHNRILAESARLKVVRGPMEDRDVCRAAIEGVTVSAKTPGGAALSEFDLCFTPAGRAYERSPVSVPLADSMVGAYTVAIERPPGLTRTVTVLPNGIARLGL